MDYRDEITGRIGLILKDVFNNRKTDFAKAIGENEARIRSYVKNKGKRAMPTAEILSKIISNIGISSDWLIIGKGEMKKESDPEPDSDEVIWLRNQIDAQNKIIENLTRALGQKEDAAANSA